VRNIKFNRLSGRNFLSIGDEPVIVDFNEGINIITGKNYDKDCVNGAGKCLDKKTRIDITINDPMVQEKYEEYLKISNCLPTPLISS